MEDKNEMVIAGESPVAVMKMAMSNNLDLDKVEKMLEIQAKWEAMEAKKAFVQAMTDFKRSPPIIERDMTNTQYSSKYSSIGNLVNTALPYMSNCGLSHKWTTTQEDGTITVTCTVTHEKGHSESTTMSGPPDISGKKNPLQQIKSTKTYLKVCTFEDVMGLASSGANLDDDGNGSKPIKYIDDKQKSNIVDMITATGTNEAEFLKWLKTDSLDNIQAKYYNTAMGALEKKGEQYDNS